MKMKGVYQVHFITSGFPKYKPGIVRICGIRAAYDPFGNQLAYCTTTGKWV